jgi:hypothetical protein
VVCDASRLRTRRPSSAPLSREPRTRKAAVPEDRSAQSRCEESVLASRIPRGRRRAPAVGSCRDRRSLSAVTSPRASGCRLLLSGLPLRRVPPRWTLPQWALPRPLPRSAPPRPLPRWAPQQPPPQTAQSVPRPQTSSNSPPLRHLQASRAEQASTRRSSPRFGSIRGSRAPRSWAPSLRALRGVVPDGRDDAAAALCLESLLLLSREQERDAGLTRNDYFSLWRAQGYAKFAGGATGEQR